MKGAYEFASEDWMDELDRVLHAVVSEAAPVAPISLSEVYLDPPRHLANGATRLGWSCRIDAGGMTFAREPSDSADLRVDVDYQAALDVARTSFAGDTGLERQTQMMGELIAAGKIVFNGSVQAPPFLNEVHNRMMKITQ